MGRDGKNRTRDEKDDRRSLPHLTLHLVRFRRLPQLVPSDLFVECLSADAQAGGAFRDVALVLFQDRTDDLLLYFIGIPGHRAGQVPVDGDLLLRLPGVSELQPRDLLAVAENDGVGDDIPQLPNIAGPRVSGQGAHDAVGDRRDAAPVGGIRLFHEGADQGGYVPDAVTERRQLQRDGAETIVEILAKLSPGAHRGEILVRCRDQAAVHGHRLRAAHALQCLLLEDAQQLRLHGEAHIPDFVEEERPAARQLEAADLAPDRAGKSPPLVPEELALQEVLVEGRAVQADEGAVAVGARVVDDFCDDFLARAGPPRRRTGTSESLTFSTIRSISFISRTCWGPNACAPPSAAIRGSRPSPGDPSGPRLPSR